MAPSSKCNNLANRGSNIGSDEEHLENDNGVICVSRRYGLRASKSRARISRTCNHAFADRPFTGHALMGCVFTTMNCLCH